MRRVFRYILIRPVLWATKKFSSRPKKDRIFPALDKLYEHIIENPGKKGTILPFDIASGKIIIFSDQHKGARNGADDFTAAEPNYLAALDYYYHQGYTLICLGDVEELWENSLSKVKKYNGKTYDAEQKFSDEDRLVKIFGNHDLYWGNDPFAWWQLKAIYKKEVKAYEGVVLELLLGDKKIHAFCTHGHQGDAQSDGNWFSKFFVARVWAPLQAYLNINPNTAAYDSEIKTLHNEIMYEWSSRQQDIVLITGHTHQPVFASLTHVERLYKSLQKAIAEKNETEVQQLQEEIKRREKDFAAVSIDYLTMRPGYFNTGCCCFQDGDITGIELCDGKIMLVKWFLKDNVPVRNVLEERDWKVLLDQL